jgi:hypothetical protein
LSPLTHHAGLVDTSVHISPIDPEVAAARLHRQLGRLESGRRSLVEHGRLLDPHMEAATEDAHDLADRVARAEAHLYAVTITLTVHAATRAELDDEITALRSLAASLLIQLRPTTLRAVYGWWTGLPTGLNHLTGPPGRTTGGLGGVFGAGPGGRVMDTAALSYAFPLASPDLPTTDPAGGRHIGDRVSGVLYGHNLASAGSLVFWDRFGLDNYNSVVLGRSGSGKSYLIKLELLRHLYRGIQAHVIDPEAEFSRLATAVGGTIIRPGAAAVRLNPFDLPIHSHPATGARTAAPDTLRRRQLFLHTFLAVALGQPLTPDERAVLDTAITTTYRQAGITNDPATWTRPAPLLRDLYTTLNAVGDNALNADTPHDPGCTGGPPDGAELAPGVDLRSVAGALATRLAPFVDGGAFADLFGGPTTTPPAGHLVVWSLRELADELKPVAMLLVLDTIWRTVTHPHDRRPRLVTVDEAWLLLQNPAGAEFLLRMAKSSRKHWAGLTVATQDVADVLASELGRAVITNAATQILMRQAPQTIDQIVSVFSLSAGQRAFLLAAERGDGLLLAGQHQAAFAALASPFEDELITTDPRQLATTRTAPEWIPLDTPPATRPAAGGPTPAGEAW